MKPDRRMLAVVFAGICAFLDMYATQPLLPMLSRAFHASKVEVSLTVSATTLAVALAAPIVGMLADTIGRKRIIVPAILGLSIPTLLAATASNLHALIVWRFAQGLLMPGIFAVMVAYISEEWAGEGVGAATSAYVTGTVIGGFSGRLITGLFAAHLGWRAAFIALAGLNLAGGAATWAWLPRSRRFTRAESVRGSLMATRRHLGNPRLLVTYAVGFNVLFSLIATFTYATFYLSAAPFRLGTAALGSIFFVYLLGVVITPVAGKWIDRLGARTALSAAIVCSMAGVALTLSHMLWLVVLGLAICSSGIFVSQAAASSQVGAEAGAARASAVGLYLTCYYVGGGVGAALPGFLWPLGGWPVCVALVAGVQLLTVLFVARFWRDREAASGAARVVSVES